MPQDPLSDWVRIMNDPEAVNRLRRSGYMSPVDGSFTGQGFSCNRCDHYRRVTSSIGDCLHKKIRAEVEKTACCNRFRYLLIGTE